MVNKFYVDEKMHKLFRQIKDERYSPFFGMNIKDVFIFSMALGFALRKRKDLQKRKDVADVDVFSEDHLLLIKCIAVNSEGNIEILMDEKKTFEIAEEFANGGISILYEIIFKTKEDPIKNIDKELTKILNR